MTRKQCQTLRNLPGLDNKYRAAVEAACQAVRGRKDGDMVWHVAAAAQEAMPPDSTEYERAVAAGIVIGLLSDD